MKGELKKFTNKQGKPGCVFNFDLMDSSGEIRVVAFSEVAEKFFNSIEQGRMYQLSKATLKPIEPGKRKWNTTGHNSEIYLEINSIVRSLTFIALLL
jgi:replication factor A1